MRIDFQNNYDVIVAGGGIAGIAAALASAESGMQTALIEKSVFPGGLATSGMVYFYLPICNGRGVQVSYGLSEKLLKASVKYGPGMPLDRWQKDRNYRYRTTFSPAAFMLALEELLEQAGVTIWYDTVITGLAENTPARSALLVRNKGGNGELSARVVIDATGDGEIAREAGNQIVTGENQLGIWALEYQENPPEEYAEELPWHALSSHLTGVIKGVISPENLSYSAISPRGVSNFILESRKWLRKRYQELKPGERYPVKIPGMADFRTAAHITGRTTIMADSYNRPFEDSIGIAADWSNAGVMQEIPYSAMLPQNTCGIIAAGRCIAAEGYAWELIRSIPAVALSGEAAGVAASLAVKANCPPEAVAISLLQEKLRERGGRMHLPETGLPYAGEPGYQPPGGKFSRH